MLDFRRLTVDSSVGSRQLTNKQLAVDNRQGEAYAARLCKRLIINDSRSKKSNMVGKYGHDRIN